MTSEYRAGGTDVESRRRRGLVSDTVVDLRNVLDPADIERLENGAVRINAMTRLSALAELSNTHPALTATAGSVANPHIRAVATLGGALLQQNRCPYYRTGEVHCFRTGHDDCPARRGDHRFGVIVDTSPCLAPHPSSMAAALMLYEATVSVRAESDVDGPRQLGIDALLGDGTDPSCEHTQTDQEILFDVTIPAPFLDERGAYRRITGRRLAEWPIVEAVVRIRWEDEAIAEARVVVGGVAPVPLRLDRIGEALEGATGQADIERVAATLGTDWFPPEQTAHKVDLLRALVADTVLAATTEGDVPEFAVHERPIHNR